MIRKVLKSRIENARLELVQADVGSDTLYLSRDLMRRAEIWPFEQVEVVNLGNGARFDIVVQDIATKDWSKVTGKSAESSFSIVLVGGATFLARAGQKISISSFGFLSLDALDEKKFSVRLVRLDDQNRPL